MFNYNIDKSLCLILIFAEIHFRCIFPSVMMVCCEFPTSATTRRLRRPPFTAGDPCCGRFLVYSQRMVTLPAHVYTPSSQRMFILQAHVYTASSQLTFILQAPSSHLYCKFPAHVYTASSQLTFILQAPSSRLYCRLPAHVYTASSQLMFILPAPSSHLYCKLPAHV